MFRSFYPDEFCHRSLAYLPMSTPRIGLWVNWHIQRLGCTFFSQSYCTF
ncbi:hypothetical protein SPWS13_2203 [Shewanella putrefaciens]|nr:hypothetical protein SPWS13_2203 [Shewanella putrefaciens]